MTALLWLTYLDERCLRSFLLFMILTMAAWRYIFLSSLPRCKVDFSTSWGVSFWTVPAILT